MFLLRIWVVILVAASLVSAAPILGLVSTGMGAVGSAEANWVLSGGTAYITNDTVFPFPIWAANSTDSKWISPRPSYAGSLADPAGDYTYTLMFNLTGFSPASAAFTYRLANDNSIVSVLLNGTSIPGAGPGFLTSLSGPLSVGPGSAAFVAGMNTLAVTINNGAGTLSNPTGMRFEVVTSNAVPVGQIPEPSTYALVGLALAALPLIRRKRRQS